MIALINGKIMTITQGTIDKGMVLIEGGKISAVGRDINIPSGCRVIDVSGKVVTPGLIDAHSHVGVFGEPMVEMNEDGNEMTDPITPHVRGLDALNPHDPAFADVLSAGVTTVYTGPGSGNLIGGTGVAIKLVGRTADEMVIPGTEAVKMALGENPKRVYGSQKRTPSTRMGNAALIREALVKAANYLESDRRARAEAEAGKEPKLPDRDLKLEVLGKLLKREMKARIHCHRADDMLTAIRIAEEFNLDFTLEHATEGYKIADLLAEKGVRCVVGPLLIGRYKMELKDISIQNPVAMDAAGIKLAITVDSFSETRWLPIHAGIAVREGMPEEKAFRAITINAAEILGIEHRVGSIEPGKDADLAVFDGHPMATFTHCDLVMINGEQVFNRN